MILGYASGAGLQVSTYLVSRYAGMRAFATIFSLIGSLMMIGAAVGPTIAGLIHDTTGSYSLLLMAAIPAVLIVSALFAGLGPYPHFANPGDAGKPQGANG